VRVDTISGCISSADYSTLKAAKWKDIIIRDFQDQPTPSLGHLNSNFLYGFHLTVSAILDLAPIVHRYPGNASEKQTSTVEIPMGMSGTVAVIELQDSQSSSLRTLIKLGFDFNFNALIQVHIKHVPISAEGLNDVMKSDWIEQVDHSRRQQLLIRSRTQSSDLSEYSFTQSRGQSVQDEALKSYEQPDIWTFTVADASTAEVTHRILELNARIVVSQVASEWTLALQAMDPRIPAFRRPPADDVSASSPGA